MSRFPFIGIRNRDRLQIIGELMLANKAYKIFEDVRNCCDLYTSLCFEEIDIDIKIDDNVSDAIDRSVMDRF